MSEIPEDIKKTADRISSEVGAIWDCDAIAKAIMTERERCASIADYWSIKASQMGNSGFYACSEVARLIRGASKNLRGE